MPFTLNVFQAFQAMAGAARGAGNAAELPANRTVTAKLAIPEYVLCRLLIHFSRDEYVTYAFVQTKAPTLSGPQAQVALCSHNIH